jgi:hypothetical protein
MREGNDVVEFFKESGADGLGLTGATHSEDWITFHSSSIAADAEFEENTSLGGLLIGTLEVRMVRFFFSPVGGRGRTKALTEDGDVAELRKPVLPTVRIGEDWGAMWIGYGNPLGCEK